MNEDLTFQQQPSRTSARTLCRHDASVHSVPRVRVVPRRRLADLRWIDRGPEPSRVEVYAREYTQGWVSYFQDGVGSRPADSFWREFRSELGERSVGMCWYCERRCDSAAEVGDRASTLDHFRPLSRFPYLAYEWSNWVFSCRRCNVDNKQSN